MDYQTITPADYQSRIFQVIDKQWMLVTAQKPDGKVNTMTASWGGMGTLWNKPVVMVFIRPQRYTLEFIEASERFTLSFLNDSHRKALALLGSKSGRDGDKIAEAGLHVMDMDGVPAFTEAETVFVCRKLYRQQMEPGAFIDAKIDAECYPDGDYHWVYVAEVEQILQR